MKDSIKTGDSVVTERDFEQYSWLAMRAAREEQAARTISMFIRDYIGDSIVGDNMPEIRRRQSDGNEYNYDVSLENGFTEEGHLVHIRRSVGSFALGRLQTNTHFVVTAEVDTGELTEWRVNDVRHVSYLDELSSEFVLTTDKLDVHQGMSEFDAQENPFLVELARREFLKQQLERDQAQARLIMSNDGMWFKPKDGALEVVYNMRELVRDVALVKQKIVEYELFMAETSKAEELLRSVS
ncbi:MAG: hypothetical protein ACMG55_13315 [Microcoleus sp.]